MASILPISKSSSRGGHDDRSALRAAIAAQAAAKDAVVKHRAAVDRARGLVADAERKAERARAGIAEAKSENARGFRVIAAYDSEAGDGASVPIPVPVRG
jgi:hypothetical protein